MTILVVGSLIGAFGLFTWQYKDWRNKQRYDRETLILDRRVELIEKINADTGDYIGHAETVIAAIKKEAPSEQINSSINKLNEQQLQWRAVSTAHEVSLLFIFPGDKYKDIIDKFKELKKSTDEVDGQVYKYHQGLITYREAIDATQSAREILTDWNLLCRNKMGDTLFKHIN